MGIPEDGNGHAEQPAGPAIRHRYTVTLLESGQITVEHFPVDPVLGTFMHMWAWEIMRDWFKSQQQSRVVLARPGPG